MRSLTFKIALFLVVIASLAITKTAQAQNDGGIWGDVKDILVGEKQLVDTNGNPLNYEGEDIEDWQERELAKQNVKILKNTEIVTLDKGGKYNIVNKEGEKMGIIYNPHPFLSQTALVKYNGKILFTGTVGPKKMQRIFTSHHPGEDQVEITWTFEGKSKIVTATFPDGYAIGRSPMGDLTHFVNGGWTLDGYTLIFMVGRNSQPICTF